MWVKVSQYTQKQSYGGCEFVISELGFAKSKSFTLFQDDEVVAVFKTKELAEDYFLRVYK